jgi:hypothetical protein
VAARSLAVKPTAAAPGSRRLSGTKGTCCQFTAIDVASGHVGRASPHPQESLGTLDQCTRPTLTASRRHHRQCVRVPL